MFLQATKAKTQHQRYKTSPLLHQIQTCLMRITLLTPIMQGEGDGQSPTFFKADRSSYNLQGWRWAPAVRVQDREGRGAPGGSCPAGPGSRGRWLGQGPSPKAQPVGMMVGGYPSRLLGPSAPPPPAGNSQTHQETGTLEAWAPQPPTRKAGCTKLPLGGNQRAKPRESPGLFAL